MDGQEDVSSMSVRPSSGESINMNTLSSAARRFRCKYCSRNFNGNARAHCKHIKSHEKRYQKHWSKKKTRTKVDANSDSLRHQENASICGTTKSNISHRKMISKQVYVYIVFAPPQSLCTCPPSPDHPMQRCMPCDCQFTYKKLIFDSIEHMHNSADTGSGYNCPKCNKTVMPMLHKAETEICLKCNNMFASGDDLNQHQQACYGYKEVETEESFKCLQCAYQTQSHASMIEHAGTHSSGDIRANLISQNSSLIHVEAPERLAEPSSMPLNPYPCPICCERFPNSSKLKQHVVTHQTRVKSSPDNVQENGVLHLPRKNSPTKHLYAVSDGDNSDVECEIIRHDDTTNSGWNLRPRKLLKPGMFYDNNPEEVEQDDNSRAPTKGLAHQCKLCERVFKRVVYLDHHKKTVHFGDKPFACLVCLKRFTLRHELSEHHRESHQGKVSFRCQYCSTLFDKMELLQNHDQSHYDEKPFSCTICGEMFVTPSNLSTHFKRHSVWGINAKQVTSCDKDDAIPSALRKTHYACPICRSTFDVIEELKEHCKVHEAERLTCKICNVTCKSRLDLLQHYKQHRYPCKYCAMDFLSLTACKKHEESHKSPRSVGVSSFKCSFCPKEFNLKSDHRIHETLHIQFDKPNATFDKCAQTTEQFICPHCSKKFSQLNDLKFHEIVHKPKPQPKTDYYCTHCGRKYNSKVALQKHRHNHYRDKLPEPTKCQDCDKVFRYVGLFREHKKTHWPERPFECLYCKERFKSKPDLEAHEAVHKIGKDHECPICTRRMRCKKNLQIHIRTHTGEKPYACAYCPKRFPQISLKRRHERKHTGECPYVCEICQRSFAYDSSLKQHYEAHKKKGEKVPEKSGMVKGRLQKEKALPRVLPGKATGKELGDPSEPCLLVPPAEPAPNLPVQEVEASQSQTEATLKENVQLRSDKSIPQHGSDTNSPIPVTIHTQLQPITVQGSHQHHQQAAVDHCRLPIAVSLVQQQQDGFQSRQTSWEPLSQHSTHTQQQQNSPHQNWQSSPTWPLSSVPLRPHQQQLQSWEISPDAANWTGHRPVSLSLIDNSMYDVVHRNSNDQREYQQ